MWKHTKFGNVLLWLGPILVFVGLCMTNVISDIPFFLGKQNDWNCTYMYRSMLFYYCESFKKVEKYED